MKQEKWKHQSTMGKNLMKGFRDQNGKPVEMSFWPYLHKYVLYWKDFCGTG